MKRVALALALLLGAAPAVAELPVVSLGGAYQDGAGAWWIPVRLTPNSEDSLFCLKSPDGTLAGNLWMTGSLTYVEDPNNPNAEFGYVTPGNFWAYPAQGVGGAIQPDPLNSHRWIIGGAGLHNDTPDGCGAGPPQNATYTLFSFKVQGEGTAFLIDNRTLIAKACDPYNYVHARVIDVTPIPVPGDPPVGGGGGGGDGSCVGDPNCFPAATVQSEGQAPTHHKRRSTWGQIKAFYR